MSLANKRRRYHIKSSLIGWGLYRMITAYGVKMLKITYHNWIQTQYHVSRALFTELMVRLKTVPRENDYARIHPVELSQCLWLKGTTELNPNDISPALLVWLNFRPVLTVIITRLFLKWFWGSNNVHDIWKRFFDCLCILVQQSSSQLLSYI